MNHVFISYDHADEKFVDELINKIQDVGVSIWKDSHSLHAGDDWRAKIDEAIKRASSLVVVITPAAALSEYVSYEWACGLGAEVKVIPILLEPAQLPQRLAAMHYLDFTISHQRPWERLIQELKAAPQVDVLAIVKKAAEALDSLDLEEQARGLTALTQIDHPSARDALARAVHHHNREVRIKSALELSRFKDARAIPGLIEAQRSWQLRWEFVRRIVPIGAAAVPALVEALGDNDDELREYAAHALGEIQQDSAAPALTKLLQDSVLPVREAAAKALEKIGGHSG